MRGALNDPPRAADEPDVDIGTILGIIAGFGLIIGSILLDGELDAFINGPGLLIVVGGTIAATLINQKLGNVMSAFGVVKQALLDSNVPTERLLEMIQEMVQKAKKDGMLGLEEIEVDDPFLERAKGMAIDGLERDILIPALERELAAVKSRHLVSQQIFRFMAATAPSMGMIGTLIGLVNMLGSLEDPAAIGPAMATALLTTFYGAVLAFLVFGPIADKLESRTKTEIGRGQIVIAGVESMINSDNKQTARARMGALLSPKERELAESE